ncbi:MAG: RNA ligase family protein [Candidatus Obscuribacterales bacterium]|nr:RNA ligase family protein [Candidatus Obscuribacterales bacterium]
MELLKYPRTHHIEGSRLQAGDEDLDSIPFSAIKGRHIVVEEKLDGANSGISFSADGKLLIQSRGHFLTGGPREKHFNLLKTWANTHACALHDVLGTRYIAYGEWLYAKHTIFYDALPHYWLEFDVFDKEHKQFLSTDRRKSLLGATAVPISAVPVLFQGELQSSRQLTNLLVRSNYVTDQRSDNLAETCRMREIDEQRTLEETDSSPLMEGLYIKVEENGVVKERYKFVRHTFLATVTQSGSHWLNRPIIPNRLIGAEDLLFRQETGS